MVAEEATAADNLTLFAKFVVADEGEATEAATTEEVVAAATLTATVGHWQQLQHSSGESICRRRNQNQQVQGRWRWQQHEKQHQ